MVTARAAFHQPIEALDLIQNGKVVAVAGHGTTLTAQAPATTGWYAAHARLAKVAGEPLVQAHTNALYVGNPAPDREARRLLARRRNAEVEWYRGASLPFATEAQRTEFFAACERARKVLEE